MSVDVAVILAAGMGSRLASITSRPKGLLELGGETLVGRSLKLLRRQGVKRVVLVVGHRADHYRAEFQGIPDVEIVENTRFAITGTMTSLDCALERIDEPFLLLEGDLLYEERSLSALLTDRRSDVILASGKTNAGDEVWIQERNGLLVSMSKACHSYRRSLPEFVGITKLSRSSGAWLRACAAGLVARNNTSASYETEGLVTLAAEHPLAVLVLADLLWGEIDNERQFDRVRNHVLPALSRIGE